MSNEDMMLDEDLEIWLAEYVEGSLPETHARRVEQWLAANPHLVADVEAARFAHEAVRDLPSPSPPIELHERILRATSRRPSLAARIAEWFAAVPSPVYASAMIAIVAGIVVYTQFSGQVAEKGALPLEIETVTVHDAMLADKPAESAKKNEETRVTLVVPERPKAEAATSEVADPAPEAPSPATHESADKLFAPVNMLGKKSDAATATKGTGETAVAGKLTAAPAAAPEQPGLVGGTMGPRTGEVAGGGGGGITVGAIGTVSHGAVAQPIAEKEAKVAETAPRPASPPRDDNRVAAKSETAKSEAKKKEAAKDDALPAPARPAPSAPPPVMASAPYEDSPGAFFGGMDRGMAVQPVSSGFVTYADDEMSIPPYIIDDTTDDRDEADLENEALTEEEEAATGLASRMQPTGYGTGARVLGAVRTGGEGQGAGRGAGRGAGAGTASRRVERVEAKPDEGRLVEAAVIAEYEGQYSGWTRAQRLLVRDEASWEQLWARVHTPLASPPPLPPVDFARQVVVGVALGSRPTGGFSVDIVGVKRVGDRLIVRLRETQPAPGSMVTEAFTQPYALVVVDLEGPVPAGLRVEFAR
ncbi:MAG: protease complex subunit PrcB family protein [Deltaproteobacteria bacterium]|nr:protease complex subunit PrcB family protein [Deltaproteobacteria bacterium]